ncbi:MAG TPA: hypothetical protein VKZ88_03945, partial [Fibrobacteria bacterium]|nr:hypothetical protein [Fibrobacteria bacterium]
HEDFRAPSRRTLLATVQTSVLRREGPLPARVAPDDSLRFRCAADVRGELEGVRADIAEALAQDPTLRPEDLAIIPADPATVWPTLRAVFAGDDRMPGNVPVLFPDGGPAEESPFLQGFRALLALADTDVTRGALLALLENAAVQRAGGLDQARITAIADFLEAAGFTRGWDRPAEKAAGGDSSLAAALERATLSLALEGDDVAAREDVWGDLPRPVPGLWNRFERAEADALLDWLERLRASLLPLRRGTTRSFADWATRLRSLRDTFLTPDATQPADMRDAHDLRRFLDEMEAWGTWSWGTGTEAAEAKADAHTKTKMEDEPGKADILLVSTLFADRFRAPDPAGRTNFLRGGVRTGSLSVLRGLPFRRVWVTGLTTDFPATGDSMPLDLRAFRRLPGESDPTARDLYALLEVIASCTETLTLSWARRGPDGRGRLPSRALSGLMAWLESDILPAGTAPAFIDFKPADIPPPPLHAATRVPFAAEPALRPAYRFTDVERFLRNPVVFTVHRTLRWEDDAALEEQEADLSADLFLGKYPGINLLDACLRSELREPGSAPATFDRLWNTRRHGGHLPPSPWDEVEERALRKKLLERLETERGALQAFVKETELRFVGSLRLGPQGVERAEPPVLNVPAFDLTPLGIDLRLGGIIPWFFQGEKGWALVAEPHRVFPAYLIQLCCAALAPEEDQQDTGHSVAAHAFSGQGYLVARDKDKGTLSACPLPPFVKRRTPDDDSGEVDDETGARHGAHGADVATERQVAQKILRDLLGDFSRALRHEGHLDDVPLEMIEGILQDGGAPADSEAWRDEITDQRRRNEEAGWERINRSERMRRALDPTLPTDIAAIIERRLQPYISWRNRLHANLKKHALDLEGVA